MKKVKVKFLTKNVFFFKRIEVVFFRLVVSSGLKWQLSKRIRLNYPLVNIQKTMANHHFQLVNPL